MIQHEGRRSRLGRVGLGALTAVIAVGLVPGVADAAKKKTKQPDRARVMSYNLYLGSDLGPATQAGLANRTDKFADEVGFVRSDVAANDFAARAKQISQDIRDRKIDLVGLQEAALWRFSSPTDGGGPSASNPNAKLADAVYVDYLDTLLKQLNVDAKSKKTCAKQVRKAKSTPGKKDNRKAKNCYRGYTLVVKQQEADLEFPADFDNDPGPDGRTYDVSGSATVPCPGTPAGAPNGPGCWLWGNDDTGFSLGEPPAAQCSDGIDNDGDGLIDWGPGAGNEPSDLVAADGANDTTKDCLDRNDNSEAPGARVGGLPQDANFDSHAYTGKPGADISGNGLDTAGQFDCNPPLPGPQDTNPAAGPAQGFTPGGPFPPFPFAGYNGDQDPTVAGSQVPVCMLHGIDGDLRLTMHDAIIKRKGAGVKTRNSNSGNFSQGSTFSVNVFGSPVRFTRGWTATDAKVRGKVFRFVNTHLESEGAGTVREDQAAELVGPGGVGTVKPTVLVGDLNSDPRGSGDLPLAIQELYKGGFFGLSGGAPTFGHGEILTDQSNVRDDSRIDHIMANDPSISVKGRRVIDEYANGLWSSDHAAVLVSFIIDKK